MDNTSNDIVQELIVKYLAGEAGTDDIRMIENWRKENRDNEKQFLEYKKTWDLAEKSSYEPGKVLTGIDLDHEWIILKNRIDNAEEAKTTILHPAQKISFLQQNWLRVAATVALVAISVIAINYLTRGTHYYAEEPGLEVNLPDGSLVTLNADSRITLSKSFNEKGRVVSLKGEAFFEVSPNAEKPFTVRLRKSEVTVLGTAFNIRALNDEELIEVVVHSGKVRFSSPNGNWIHLVAGQKGLFSKDSGGFNKFENMDINYLSWKTREIIFPDDELHFIIRTLNRIYDAQIVIESQRVEFCRVSVRFKDQSLDSILRVLESTLDISIEKTDDKKYVISGSGC